MASREDFYTLDQLPNLERDDQPKFVFAHIFAPHPPFVLGRHGEAIYPDRQYMYNDGSDFKQVASLDEYINGYRDQLAFINTKLQTTIGLILSRSSEAPIIIIQADHGPGSMLDLRNLEKSNMWERMTILNAYFLPGGYTAQLYPGITPVNTFRIIFNHYFGGSFPLLEDKSYYSPVDDQFRFTDVTNQIPPNYKE